MSDEGLAAEAADLVNNLEKMLEDPARTGMKSAYRIWCRPHLPGKVQMSMMIGQTPGIYSFLAILPWAALALLALYWVWVVRSHRKYARRLFRSGYAEDIRG